MTLVVGDDLHTPTTLNTNARVGCSEICTRVRQGRVSDTLLLTDTNYRPVLCLLIIGIHGNRAQKNEGEEGKKEK